jgi:hypothetical protein
MNPDLTGMIVIGLLGLILISLALICRLGGSRPTHHPPYVGPRLPPPDITLGFRDPYR